MLRDIMHQTSLILLEFSLCVSLGVDCENVNKLFNCDPHCLRLPDYQFIYIWLLAADRIQKSSLKICLTFFVVLSAFR